MKHTRLVIAALAVAALGAWAVLAFAGSKNSAAAASSNGSTCSAAMAAKCTPEMAAACKAKMSAAAASGLCPHSAKGASNASGACPYHNSVNAGVSAITASSDAGGAQGSCAAHAAGASACGSGAVTAGTEAGKGKNSCSAHAAGGSGATAAGSGKCDGRGMVTAADRSSHAGCDACADMASCEGEVQSFGAMMQVVPLKNGVMYVYTANGASRVQAVQASMARRSDRLTAIMAAGDKTRLCSACKAIRGAVASGKLNRELVNIEGGCLTLMTSSDPRMVAKIYDMAGVKGPMASKL